MNEGRFQFAPPSATNTSLKVLSALAFFCLAASASAHTGEGGANGFLAGVLHPLTGFDHLLAMVAVGICFSHAHGCRWSSWNRWSSTSVH